MKIPFAFISDHLFPLETTIKQMFGMFAVYSEDKILFLLRKKTTHPEANGIWIATKNEYHTSLKKDIPALISIAYLAEGLNETEWQLIPEADDNFENSTITLCELIKKKDIRIGKVPKIKRPAKVNK